MKRYFTVVITIILLVISYFKLIPIIRDMASVDKKDGINYVSMVDDKNFYINKYGKWQKEFIKGVNIGAAKPNSFPGELTITKDEYKRWFKYIGEMNANTIRVYTILKPDFYEALYEYNKNAVNPIYVMHGVWVNEEDIINLKDAYNPKIMDRFKGDIKSVIDIIHGNCTLKEERGHASGVYTRDVSKYFTGWILGIEWDPEFVIETNEKNSDKSSFSGKYLYTEGASPFEAWLAEAGDFAIEYETEKYKMQRPLSFTNWVTTDMLNHPNEPLKNEDLVTVNTEHIKRRDSFIPGLFASYHIYPYYPDFMNYDKRYADFKDENGKVNTYRAYLRDLRKEHKVPVLVAEFGVPSSRGKAHENIHMGFNQGFIDEKTQGQMDEFMLKNIFEEGYAGGLVFTWQDEWFKRTWNTMDLDIADRRPYFSNTQTNEQRFGVLAFDPGEKKRVSYVDGSTAEWKKEKPILQGDKSSLYIKYDAEYVYLYAKVKEFDEKKDKLIIPIDLIENQGNTSFKDMAIDFDRPSDFLIIIDGREESKILVDAYYDSFYYIYRSLNMLEANKAYETKNSGIFNPMYLALNRSLFLPEDKRELPLSKYETGKLTYGIGNPKDKNYNSLADFYINGEDIEIRIPWQLLNVMDPSTNIIMDDLYKGGVKPVKKDMMHIGTVVVKNNEVEEKSNMVEFRFKGWEKVEYHERLKPSYYILKKAFEEVGVK